MTKTASGHQESIAIIGMACIFPQAPDLRTFWRNILAGVDAVGEPPLEWEASRYLDSGRIETARGGYLGDLYRFDPREFGIMPNSLDGGEPDQFLALRIAHDALQDAGYLHRSCDHSATGIVLGHSAYLHRGQGTMIQHGIILDQTLELLCAAHPGLDSEALSSIRSALEKKLPQFNADIVPGLVPNVMTGRIANRLNLRGPNYLVDAACASSLLAVNAAMDELRAGRSRLMLAGGVNASLPPEIAVIFTQLGALTKRGRVRPFEAGSDGTLLGEGLGVVALKRLSDAMTDGDRIYAVLRGIGQASDGKGLGLLAPSPEGETLAMARALEAAGVDASTLELIEAHGSGIPLGDKTEITAIRNILGSRRGARGSVAVGSVKSMISHCIPAAGIAGLIKTALALHHKILPPTLCDRVNPELGIEQTPLYVNTACRPWIARPDTRRRAGVNAFGFGGINAHAVMEEAPNRASVPPRLSRWPAELCVFSGDDDHELAAQLAACADLCARDGADLGDIAAARAAADGNRSHRMALVARSPHDLAGKISQARERLKTNPAERWTAANGIWYSRLPVDGKLAFLFPGEGSQYLNMLDDVALHFAEARKWFEFWQGLYPSEPGAGRTDLVFPPASELTPGRRDELDKQIHAMDVGSEAVFIGSQALASVLSGLGIRPDVMAGHSTGESSALVASGALASGDPAALADAIRELNRVYKRVLAEGKIPTGALLSVGALPHQVVEEHIAARRNGLIIAMDNCTNQLVVYGEPSCMEALQESLSAAGGICLPLPFNRGYHTHHFSAMSEAFREYYGRVGLGVPQVPLYSCASAGLFPQDAAGVRELAAGQWSSRVRFRETVLRMHADGVRTFVEVGPSGVLTSFVNDILAGKEFLSLATDNRRRSSVEQLLHALGGLYVNRKGLQTAKLFASRSVNPAALQAGNRGMRLANTMPIIHLAEADRAALQAILGRKGAAPSTHLDDGTGSDTGSAPIRNDRKPDRETCPAPEVDAPFITSIIDQDDQRLSATCRLSLSEDNFLRHHLLSGPVSGYDPHLSGLACVPLTVSLEIMAEGCALLKGSTDVRAIRNVKAFDWIALDNEEVALEVRAEASGPCCCRAGLLENGRLLLQAEFLFSEEAHCELQALPELEQPWSSPWDGEELYTFGMFHGPMFRTIRHIAGWNNQGIDADLSEAGLYGFFADGQSPCLVLNPILLDAIGQLSAYWIAHRFGTDFNCFPTTIDRIELYSACPGNLPGLRLKARQTPLDPGQDALDARRSWQFECLDREGHALFRVLNLAHVYYPVPHAYCQARIDPLTGWLGTPLSSPEQGEALLWQVPLLAEKFCVQSGGIFMRILAHAVLSRGERAEWSALPPNVRTRREWLLGRACLKEAVRYWLLQQTDRLVHPADVIVMHEENGAPYVTGAWAGSLADPPEVSLSHDRSVSLAAVSRPCHPVGVDIEQVARCKDPALLQGALSTTERNALDGCDNGALQEKVLRMWCAKEAAAKYLGSGLRGRPDEFEVSFLDTAWQRAEVRHTGSVVEVDVRSGNGVVIAVANRHTA